MIAADELKLAVSAQRAVADRVNVAASAVKPDDDLMLREMEGLDVDAEAFRHYVMLTCLRHYVASGGGLLGATAVAYSAFLLGVQAARAEAGL